MARLTHKVDCQDRPTWLSLCRSLDFEERIHGESADDNTRRPNSSLFHPKEAQNKEMVGTVRLSTSNELGSLKNQRRSRSWDYIHAAGTNLSGGKLVRRKVVAGAATVAVLLLVGSALALFYSRPPGP